MPAQAPVAVTVMTVQVRQNSKSKMINHAKMRNTSIVTPAMADATPKRPKPFIIAATVSFNL